MVGMRSLAQMDSEADAFIAVEQAAASRNQPVDRIRRELFAAKAMAGAALGFGLLSLVLLAAVLPRLGSLPASSSLRGVVGLDAVGAQRQQAADQTSGWYRTYLKTMVRRGLELESEQMTELPVGALVFVAEARGRRARVMKPVEGWMSLQTDEGIEILRPDMTYEGPANMTDFDRVLRSRAMRERNMKLQATAAKLTALQRQLLESSRKVKAKKEELERTSHRVSSDLRHKAPAEVGQQFAHSAAQVLATAAKRPDAQNVLRQLTRDKDLQQLFKR